MILQEIAASLGNMLSLDHFIYLWLGVLMGYVLGILPGLGSVAGLALLLPYTYDMPPSAALVMMIGLIAPQHTSDTMPAVLMGIPGSASAQATVLDGFPLSKQGKAARALSAAYVSSMIGGVIGAIVLTAAIFAARPLILAMGFPELMMLVIWSLSMVGAISGISALKGMAACTVGLMIGSIGSASATAELRLTLDTLYLMEGIPLVIAALSIYAIPEIIDLLRNSKSIAESREIGSGWRLGFLDAIRNRWLILRCSGLGCVIGALPGIGSSVVDWLAYGHAVQSAKDKSQFGKGDIRGVIAPESANNATLGGSLIPTLLFGVPGSASMAILLGGFMLIGISPGANMVSTDLDLTFTIIWSLALANIFGGLLCFITSRPFSRLTTVRYALIAPIMLTVVFFGAIQASRSWGDLIALILLGVFGTLMRRFGWSRPALLIGFVLSDQLEGSVYRAVQIYGLNFFDRPIVIVLLCLIALTVFGAVRMKRIDPDLMSGEGGEGDRRARLPQIGFTLVLLGFAAVVLADSFGHTYLARMFPQSVSALALVLIVGVLGFQIFGPPTTKVLHDGEVASTARQSSTHYMLWIVGYAGLIAVFGFTIASTLFIFAFTTVKSDASLTLRAGLSLGCLAVLTFVVWWLDLRYINGLLQHWVQMPWWMG